MKKPIVLFLTLLILLLITPTESSADKLQLNLTKGEIAYTFFDLTHGEATLIQGDRDQTVLINTGHGQSEEELEERLNMFNVSSIDTLIITSKQIEYIGNLPWILGNYDIERLFLPQSLFTKFEKLLSDFDVQVTTYKKGDHYSLLNDLHIEILYVEDKEGDDKGGSAFFINHFDQKLLYMTVANPHVEKQLVQEFDLKSTMFKVPDFGSDRGTSEDLLDEVDPQVAVIFRNGENKPSSYVMERLQETWIDIYQTSRIGTVTIKCNEKDYEIITVRPKKDGLFPKSWFTRK
ncbi:ComEC/Rec2 family competence protein [Evansella sp. AB-rgal1]|uniref:ComEC/Rec2 family competence protein n=1 Tax=Evansella sp. AB-rgal1 TaxID=3242696 RepID=UPI00359CBAF6